MSPDIRKKIAYALLAVLLIFIIINLETATVNFFFIVTFKMPVAFLLFFAAATGAGAVFLLKHFKKDEAEDTPEDKPDVPEDETDEVPPAE